MGQCTVLVSVTSESSQLSMCLCLFWISSTSVGERMRVQVLYEIVNIKQHLSHATYRQLSNLVSLDNTYTAFYCLSIFSLLWLGGGDGRGRYRTVSGASVDSAPPAPPSSRPSLSLTSLTGYVQQLRAYLPNAPTTGIQVSPLILIGR